MPLLRDAMDEGVLLSPFVLGGHREREAGLRAWGEQEPCHLSTTCAGMIPGGSGPPTVMFGKGPWDTSRDAPRT